MRILPLTIVLAVALSSAAPSYASSNVATDWDQYFSEQKKHDIENNDLASVEKQLKGVLGKDIRLTVDWNSFKGSDYDGAEELGASIQDMAVLITNMSEKPDDVEMLRSKLTTINFRNTVNPIPSMTFAAGVLTLQGQYGNMQWSKAERMAIMARRAMQ